MTTKMMTVFMLATVALTSLPVYAQDSASTERGTARRADEMVARGAVWHVHPLGTRQSQGHRDRLVARTGTATASAAAKFPPRCTMTSTSSSTPRNSTPRNGSPSPRPPA